MLKRYGPSLWDRKVGGGAGGFKNVINLTLSLQQRVRSSTVIRTNFSLGTRYEVDETDTQGMTVND